MNNFAWEAITLFRIFGASQAYFCSLKGCYQYRYYCRECLYSQISLKVWDSDEKNWRFRWDCLWDTILHDWACLGTFSVYLGIALSFCASAHHSHTTLATGEWMIFWPSKDSPVTECSRHLVFESSLHVMLLSTTLQSIILLLSLIPRTSLSLVH